jgi:hypothetical protein
METESKPKEAVSKLYKNFLSWLQLKRLNKQECWPLPACGLTQAPTLRGTPERGSSKTFQPVLIFAYKALSLPWRKHLKGSPPG